MNVLNESAFRECTSCQVCAAVCPKRAIDIQLDQDGFYRPYINDSLCVDCGICVKICYKFDEKVKQTDNAILKECDMYSGWSKNDQVLKCTTSGGIADVIAKNLFLEGYTVVGCVYNEDTTRAEHISAVSEESLDAFRGSKYIQSYTLQAFKNIVNNNSKKKYAVFGTPCQIYGLSKYATIRNNKKNFIFIDLFCHGCPSIYAWTKYNSYVKKTLKVETFDKVEFRSKVKGWGTYCVSFYKDNKRIFSSGRNLRGFYELFFSDQILNQACNTCILRNSLEYTDIRLGDFWGKKFLNNHKGVSIISLTSDKGKEFFNKIKDQIIFESAVYSEILPYQSWGHIHTPNIRIRNSILSSLRDPSKDVNDALRILHKNQSLKQKLVRFIKFFLALFPLGFSNFIKKIL